MTKRFEVSRNQPIHVVRWMSEEVLGWDSVCGGDEQYEIVVQRRTHKGKDRLDIRLWTYYEAHDEWRPTKKGVVVPPKQGEKLAEVIYKLSKDFS